ncbi:hypothetical protein D3C86_1648640 [compost metagenome]
MGRPMGTLSAPSSMQVQWVTSMAASVGPYRLYKPAPGSFLNTCNWASSGKASPLQTMRLRLVQASTPGS